MKTKLDIVTRFFRRGWLWMIRHDAFIYLLFVGITTLFWWGRSMSSPREMTFAMPVEYTDIPADVAFSEALPQTLTITLRDNGKTLRQISHSLPTINIHVADQLTKAEGELQLSADILRPRIQDALPGSAVIQQIRPENIATQYYRLVRKDVPIALRMSLTMAQQYQLSEPPQLQPNSIAIYGNQEAIDSIACIPTDSLVLTNLNESKQMTLSLIIPDGIMVHTHTTEVTINTEQFTDKTFTLPIHIDNISPDETIHLFPQEVVVTVRVGVSHFADIDAQQFQAICPYPSAADKTLPVHIKHNNPYITKIRTNIQEVEYIIER